MRARKSRTNAIVFLALCLAVALMTQLWSRIEKRPAIAEKTVTDFSYTTLAGTTGTLSDLKAPVVVHFWATWCVPCIQEFPALIDKAAKTPDVTFMLISADRKKGDITNFLKSMPSIKHKNVILAFDPKAKIAKDIFNVVGFPETFILSKSGKIKSHLIGPVPWLSFDDF